MNTINTIQSRKSVRSYTGEKLSECDLNTIIKSAEASPVGMGKFGILHLTVIENEDFLKSFDIAAAKLFGKPDLHPLYGAPTLILVSSSAYGETLGNAEYSNAAIMVHNMALTAVDLGAGYCYIWGAVAALNKNQDLVNQLDLPAGFTPCCGIVLGKTSENYSLRDIPEDRIGINYVK